MPYDQATLREASHHAFYEVVMFRETAGLLAQGAFAGALHDAVLESFVLHFRNLYAFCHQRTSLDFMRSGTDAEHLEIVTAARPGYHNSDVCAADFFDTPQDWERLIDPPPLELMADFIRAKKHVLHLTQERIRQVEGGTKTAPLLDEKVWYLGRVYELMLPLVEAWLKNAPRTALDASSPYFARACPAHETSRLDYEYLHVSGGPADYPQEFIVPADHENRG